jgi:hypothetical protein
MRVEHMDDFEATMIAEGVEPADDDKQIEAWQHLIDTGLCWRLQGWFGRRAEELINEGICHEPGVKKVSDLDPEDQAAWDEAMRED